MFILSEKKLLNLSGLLGGLLAGLALSNGPVFLMWLAVALLWSASRRIFSGFLWGLVAVLVSHSWLLALHPLSWIGVPYPLSLPIATTIWLFCGVVGGILVAIWCGLAKTSFFVGLRNGDRLKKFCSAFALSAIWGLTEVFLAHSPFFWIGLGGSVLPGDMMLAGLARWIGAGGLAVVQLCIGFCVWNIVDAFFKEADWRKSIIFTFVFFLLVHFIGSRLLISRTSGELFSVALWQSDIPIRTKFSQEQQQRLPEALNKSLLKAKGLSASWLVAPEGTLRANQDLLSPAPIPFLSGGFRWVRGTQRSSLLGFEAGDVSFSSAIDKYRLVPLGERVPSIFSLPIHGLSAVGGLEPGEPSRLLRWSSRPKVGVAICYEISDGHAIASAVQEGAEWILASANLDPYPLSLQRQFLALAQLRSIENARDLISVANTGPSGLVLASGQVEKLVPPFKDVTELVELHLYGSDLTFYTKWKEMPLTLFLMGNCCVILNLRMRSK